MRKWSRILVSVLISAALNLGAAEAVSAKKAVGAKFEGKDTLLLPKGYREWVFIGSTLGLEYDGTDGKGVSEKLEFKNVYINPPAYREFLKTGNFQDATILVLETGTAGTKHEPGLKGSYLSEFTGVSAAVKDTRRFADGWAYFGFRGKAGKLTERAQPFAKSACYDCHREKGTHDNVFTQFYPVLRDARTK